MSEKPKTISILFPDLSPEELKEADEAFRRYFAFIIRLYNRLESKRKEAAGPSTKAASGGKKEPGRTFIKEYDDTNI